MTCARHNNYEQKRWTREDTRFLKALLKRGFTNQDCSLIMRKPIDLIKVKVMVLLKDYKNVR